MTGLCLFLVVASLAAAPRALPAEEPSPGAPAAPVAAEVPKHPHVTLDLSLGAGSGNSTGESEPQISWGLHLSGRPGPIVVAASMEGATNFIGSLHAFFTGGVGGWRQLQAGRIVVVGLYGVHGLEVLDFVGTATEHRLQTLGVRAAWEGDVGNWLLPRASVSATAYFDLESAYDASVAGDVGGVTVLVSVALGLGV